LATFFLTCAALGGAVLVLQLLLGLLGLHQGDMPDVHSGDGLASEGLALRSVRAMSAGLTFFGLGGLAGLRLDLGWPVALVIGAVAGAAAMVGVAALLRSFMRLESDGTVAIERAIGVTGTVYLAIPGGRDGPGKVHLKLQNRTVECQAVTPDSAIPTGASVLVVDVEGSDTVVVVSNPLQNEASHVAL